MKTPFVASDMEGRIMYYGEMDADVIPDHMTATGHNVVAGVGRPETHYVLDDEIVERPALPSFDKTTIVADDEDMASLLLPELMTVKVDGETYGPLTRVDIVSDMPATYIVEINHWPYLPMKVEIVAT